MIFPNESQEYRDARDALLRQEVELMRQLEAVTGAGGVQDDGGVIVVAFHRGALLGQVGDQFRQLGVVDDPALSTGLVGARHSLFGYGRSGKQRPGSLLDR